MVGAGDYEKVGNRGRERGLRQEGDAEKRREEGDTLAMERWCAKETTLKGWRKTTERWGKQRQEEAVGEPGDLTSHYPSTRGMYIVQGQSDMTPSGHRLSKNTSPHSPESWLPL